MKQSTTPLPFTGVDLVCARLAAGLTRDELAEEFGLSEERVFAAEHGEIRAEDRDLFVTWWRTTGADLLVC